MPTDMFESRRKSLESDFFAKRERELIEKMRVVLEKERPRETLEKFTGITDPKVVDTLIALHVNHNTLAAFALYPLVEIAWADGSVDEKEREAFLKAAASQGIVAGTPGYEVLREFLKDTPREEARNAWRAWAAELNKNLDAQERKQVREALLARARAVAEASGGFLGLGNRISASEQLVLDRIAEVFAD
jgi:tellurite resistance protein